MTDLIIYGAGSVGRLAEQIVSDINQKNPQFNLLGFLDDDKSKQHTTLNHTPILGGIEWLKKNPGVSVVIGFSKPSEKLELVKRINAVGHHTFPSLIHPDTWISKRVKIGHGSIIYPGVHLDVDIRLGNFNLLNKLVTVGHDTVTGNYITISPGVNVGGINSIGDGVEFGINSCSIQQLKIGAWATIGAGAVIIRDVADHAVVVGNPGRVLDKSNQAK